MKRTLDFSVALLASVLLLPLIVLLWILVRSSLGSPVLFSQVRPGLQGKPFRLYKFRTMRNVQDASGKPLPDEARLTRLGRFLRSASLDELPSLWNVLNGDMSLVGPRPLLPEYLPLYSARQSRRHDVRPGITGWAQVNGRNAISWEDKFEKDVWYVENRTLWLDIRILLMTLGKVFFRKDISHAGSATMPPFTGNTE